MNPTIFQDAADIPFTDQGHDKSAHLDHGSSQGLDDWDAQLLFFLLHG